MADQPKPPLPAGFQRPGVPGAGNILDPAVRGELRGKLHDAVHGARPQQAQPPEQKPQSDEAAPADSDVSKEEPAAEKPAAPQGGIGPFANGDVDLSTHPANVFHGVRPKRGKSVRKFYFLAEETPSTEKEETPKPDGASPLPPRKPG